MRGFYGYIFGLFLSSSLSLVINDESCDRNVVKHLDVDFLIGVVLPLHVKPHCSEVSPSKLELMESAKWAVERLNKRNYFKNRTLGITFHDSCASSSPKRAILDAAVGGGFLLPEKCDQPKRLALLISDSDLTEESFFLEDVAIPYSIVPEAKMGSNLKALLSLLLRLKWTKIAVFVSSKEIHEELNEMFANVDVCIDSVHIISHESKEKLEIKDIDGVALIGSTQELIQLWRKNLTHARGFGRRAIFVPSDDIVSNDLAGMNLSPETYIIKRVSKCIPEFAIYYTKLMSRKNASKDLNFDSYVEGVEIFEMVKSVFGVASSLHKVEKVDCFQGKNCSFDTEMFSYLMKPNVDDMKRYMNINPEQPRFEIDHYNSTRLSLTKVGFFYGGVLSLSEDLISLPKDDSPEVISCIIKHHELYNVIIWREDKWIIILMTIALLGCSISVMIGLFIVIFTRYASPTEGSRGFTLLLVASILLLYSSLFAYAIEDFAFVCALRPFWSGVAYAFLFSSLLSRTLMIATADTRSSIGHVSGVVQTSLVFFMSSVQIGIGISQWMSSDINLSSTSEISCQEDFYILYYLSYVQLLLILQFFTAPFALKSKRNLNEGRLYFSATICLAGVWSAWITCFILCQVEWRRFIICCGIVSSSSVFLLTVLIPKSYLLVLEMAPSVPPVPSSIRSKQPCDPSSLAFFNSVPPMGGVNYVVPFSSTYGYNGPTNIMERERDYGDAIYFNPSPSKVTHI